MARTINPKIEIFNTETAARRYFSKCEAPVTLLWAPSTAQYYVDKNGSGPEGAITQWPKLYKLLDEK